MKLAALEEYGLRCALQLAKLPVGDVASASQIAENEGISVQYASKILHLFRKANLVLAVRGMQGGFRLSQEPQEINVKRVFQALREEPETTNFCGQFKGQQEVCVHSHDCSVRPVWQVLTSYFDIVLQQLTLADLAGNEMNSQAKIERLAESQSAFIQQRFFPKAATVAAEMIRS